MHEEQQSQEQEEQEYLVLTVHESDECVDFVFAMPTGAQMVLRVPLPTDSDTLTESCSLLSDYAFSCVKEATERIARSQLN